MSSTEIYLDVPLLNQFEIFPTKQTNMACWYTSAFMVLMYRMSVGSVVNMAQIDTLKRLYGNGGLLAHEDAALAKEVGMEHSPSSVLFQNRDAAEYCKALSTLGPLLISEPTHVVVVRGCVKGVAGQTMIAVNDPWGGVEKLYPIAEFNQRIAWNFPIHYRRTKHETPLVLKAGPNMAPYQCKF